MFDGEGQMFLHNGRRSFAHTVEVGHFVVFKYDDHCVFTVKAFDETMTRTTRRRKYEDDLVFYCVFIKFYQFASSIFVSKYVCKFKIFYAI
jgi:hypothetical protein